MASLPAAEPSSSRRRRKRSYRSRRGSRSRKDSRKLHKPPPSRDLDRCQVPLLGTHRREIRRRHGSRLRRREILHERDPTK
jgi:hypothetical protein